MTTTDSTGSIPDTGRFAAVNGLDLYYEVHGEGRPLVLLHGGLGSGEMFVPVLPAFADGHQVILPDLQGHGRTADIDRPLDVRLMADDVAALVDHLGLGPVDVVGFSLGGGWPCRRRCATRTRSGAWSPARRTSGARRPTPRCASSRPRSARPRPSC